MLQDSLASARVQTADRTGETVASSRLDSLYGADVKLTAPTGPQDFIDQSQNIARQTFRQSGLPSYFSNVQATGKRAARALDIVDQTYIDNELAKVPLEAMQQEVSDLQAQRTRVLPDILADPTIKDFRSKVRIASKLQAMFDSEIGDILAKKKDLEDRAESRGRMKVDELRAKADVINKEFEMDKFALSEAMDLFKTGQATLQDILEAAVRMRENAAKAGKGSGKDNPYVGTPGSDFTFNEIAMFVKAERNEGRLDLSDSVNASKREEWNARYFEWILAGKPVHGIPVSGPSTPNGIRPTTSTTFDKLPDEFRFPKNEDSGLQPQDLLTIMAASRAQQDSP